MRLVALCWKCNLRQGTKSFAATDRDMEYNDTGNKVRSFLNDKLLGDGVPSFDLHRAKRSMSLVAELEEFRIKVQNNSRDWADKKVAYLRPLANRYASTNDPNYRKFDIMIKMIIQKYGNN